jgi:hypothetical protein
LVIISRASSAANAPAQATAKAIRETASFFMSE